MKYVYAIGLLLAAFAVGAHDITDVDVDTTIVNNYYYSEEPTETNGDGSVSTPAGFNTGIGNSAFENAAAMSAAGDTCVFDYAPGWQACVGGGWYGSASAINGSMATRIDQFVIRFNLQADTDFDDQSYGVGGSWHF